MANSAVGVVRTICWEFRRKFYEDGTRERLEKVKRRCSYSYDAQWVALIISLGSNHGARGRGVIKAAKQPIESVDTYIKAIEEYTVCGEERESVWESADGREKMLSGGKLTCRW
jgi:hypothetical protein